MNCPAEEGVGTQGEGMLSLAPSHLLLELALHCYIQWILVETLFVFFLSPKEEFALEAQYPGGMHIISPEQNKADTGC